MWLSQTFSGQFASECFSRTGWEMSKEDGKCKRTLQLDKDQDELGSSETALVICTTQTRKTSTGQEIICALEFSLEKNQ